MLMLSLVMLAACEGAPGRDGRDGRDGIDGRDGLGEISTVMIDVPQISWKYSNIDRSNYFYATVQMPEIDQTVLRNGIVQVYRVLDYNTDYEVQQLLPFTLHDETEVGGYNWHESLDYEISLGLLTIYYTASDFDYELDTQFVPSAMKFRCVILY